MNKITQDYKKKLALNESFYWDGNDYMPSNENYKKHKYYKRIKHRGCTATHFAWYGYEGWQYALWIEGDGMGLHSGCTPRYTKSQLKKVIDKYLRLKVKYNQ